MDFSPQRKLYFCRPYMPEVNFSEVCVVKDQKEKELQFYLDRMSEAALTILKSIVTDPRLNEEDAMKMLFRISDQHKQVVAVIEENYARAGEKLQNFCGDDWH